MTQYLIPKLHSILDILSIFHDWIRAVYVQIFWLCTWSLRHPWKTRVPSFGKISPCCCNCESYCWIFLIEINFLIGLWNISFRIWHMWLVALLNPWKIEQSWKCIFLKHYSHMNTKWALKEKSINGLLRNCIFKIFI